MLNRDSSYRPLPPGVEILPPGKDAGGHQKSVDAPKGFPWPKILLMALLMLLYTASPLDLIPDVIPFLGWLDDLAIDSGIVALILRTVYVYYRGRNPGVASPIGGKSWLRAFFTRWVMKRVFR
jgi:hypothetical protein